MNDTNVTSKTAQLISQLVEEFAKTNSFDAKSPEFENVTPGRWNKQLKLCCNLLEDDLIERLDELFERYAVSLHEGDFLK